MNRQFYQTISLPTETQETFEFFVVEIKRCSISSRLHSETASCRIKYDEQEQLFHWSLLVRMGKSRDNGSLDHQTM